MSVSKFRRLFTMFKLAQPDGLRTVDLYKLANAIIDDMKSGVNIRIVPRAGANTSIKRAVEEISQYIAACAVREIQMSMPFIPEHLVKPPKIDLRWIEKETFPFSVLIDAEADASPPNGSRRTLKYGDLRGTVVVVDCHDSHEQLFEKNGITYRYVWDGNYMVFSDAFNTEGGFPVDGYKEPESEYGE